MSVKPTYEELERYGRQADITIENLELKLAESQREFRAADATIENLQMQVKKLAAENAGQKVICEDRRTFIMNGVQLGYIQVPTVETDPALETIRIAVSPQAPTPATDAFLAEVRAQGVESLSDAVKSVIAERQRQQSVEGWTTARDDEYEHGELADAAGCYALSSELFDCVGEPPRQWPWPDEWWKPSMRRRDLVKAGALILAEIERLDRHELSSIQKGAQS